MQVGILGGSFDPIHNGHLYMCNCALKEADLDEIWVIPAGHSPNKDENQMTAAIHRLNMCELATLEYDNIVTNSIEVDSTMRSYTYLTLQNLKKQFPNYKFYFLMGADSLDYFDEWKHPEIIASLATILVVNRDEFTNDDLQNKIESITAIFHADIQILNCKKYPISSHEIRAKHKNHQDISNDVPRPVMEYIEQNHLYI